MPTSLKGVGLLSHISSYLRNISVVSLRTESLNFLEDS